MVVSTGTGIIHTHQRPFHQEASKQRMDDDRTLTGLVLGVACLLGGRKNIWSITPLPLYPDFLSEQTVE